jgi:hypothetical protein
VRDFLWHDNEEVEVIWHQNEASNKVPTFQSREAELLKRIKD